MPWFLSEVGAAGFLGLGSKSKSLASISFHSGIGLSLARFFRFFKVGLMMGTIAFVASGLDAAFGITIFIAQMISILTAGITGTFAPLLFSFIFKRDSGKWGGPLETAIQDIVGSFAMVIISYHVLLLLGGNSVDPDDTCGGPAKAG
jgi:cation transporter-like permease